MSAVLKLRMLPRATLKGRVTAVLATATGAAGSNGQVQFNNAGALDGDAELIYDPITDTLTVVNLHHTGRLLDTVINLADGPTVALNAALGDVFFLGASGNRTILVPTNAPAVGLTQKIIIRHEAIGGARTLSLTTGSGGFRFGTLVTGLTATSSGLVDYIGAIWNGPDDRWDVVSYSKGF